MVTAHIRKADLEDAEALAAFGALAFRNTYEADNDPANMADYLAENFTEESMVDELREVSSSFLIAHLGSQTSIAGFAKLRAGSQVPCDLEQPSIELERIYVGKAALGQGVGSTLMKECLDTAKQGDWRTLWLGVWEQNRSAIAFYRRWGFEKVGFRTFLFGAEPQRDYVMAREV